MTQKQAKIWVTSDLHLMHRKILEYAHRPFSTVEEMNEKIISNWNEKVKDEDTIYILGDFAFSSTDYIKSALYRLKGKKHLIVGNHDKWARKVKVFEPLLSLEKMLEIKVKDPDAPRGTQHITMCHFPLLVWNHAHHGGWSLHGHSHGTLNPMWKGKRLDVGVDCHNFYPISYEEVKEIMKKKEFHANDRHGSNRE